MDKQAQQLRNDNRGAVTVTVTHLGRGQPTPLPNVSYVWAPAVTPQHTYIYYNYETYYLTILVSILNYI